MLIRPSSINIAIRIEGRLIAYHTSVLEQLDATPTESLEGVFFRDNRFLIYDIEIAPQGISQEILKDIAWSAAERETISGRISFVKSQLLFETYHQQDNVYSTVTKLVDVLSERETHRRALVEETIAMIYQLFEELKAQEKLLLYRYEECLERIW